MDERKWLDVPHGLGVPEEFREWYLRECGYFYDKEKAKEGISGWVVDGDDIVNDVIQERDIPEKKVKKGDLCKGLRAFRFDQQYAFAKKKLQRKYPSDKNLYTNENIFLMMQGKTIRIDGRDEYE